MRQALAGAEHCKIPQNYRYLFQINVKGIVTFNLDRLVGRAFSVERSGAKCIEFCGNQCSEYAHVLQGSNVFILNAHGVVDSTRSWILKKDQLNWLLKDPAYCSFMQSVLMSHTVVFVGISVDDVAITAHLHRLATKGISVRGHYWVTDRHDLKTNQWAEREGILVIRYPDIDDHAALGEMLEDIAKYRPRDPEYLEPVEPCTSEATLQILPSPDELLREREEVIRGKLNAHARFLLREENASRYQDYEQFRRRYDKCIHRCWYLNTTPPDNYIMGYELVKDIAEGAFGRVFEAKTRNGRRVALKLLKEDVRRKPDMLQSFRRGVRAMRILSEHKVEGMVGYTDCSEIPAFAVMDFIDGPNLKEAVQSGYFDDWHDLLRVAVELASVIRRAHQLPERVLHRDIRPANIMLKDYNVDPEKSHVVVLDFDLSWYKDALEVSVTQRPAMHGYLAPELMDRDMGYSTRSAAVDSFGLGMTLYFMRTKTDPMYMQHRHATWSEDVLRLVGSYRSRTWQSLPRRFADLILLCTRDKQPERCDVAHIIGELQRLHAANLEPTSVRAADLLCHELAYRCCSGISQIANLRWDYGREQALFGMATGVTLKLSSDEKRHSVTGLLSWEDTGCTESRNVRKYLNNRVEKALSILSNSGYTITDRPVNTAHGSRFGFECRCESLARALDKMSSSLAEAVQAMRLD